jgi:hypothetical protein
MAEIQQAFGRRVRTLRGAWKRAGMEGVAMLALRSRLVPRKLLFVHDVHVLKLVELNVRALVALSGAYEFAIADASILEELVECTDTPASIELRRQALARVLALGASCITVRHRGRVVAYFCAFAGKYLLTYDDYGPKTLTFALDEKTIFLGNGFIRPEYRMKGLFPHLLRDCVARYPPGTRFFGHMDADNVHSFNSHRRLGFVPLLSVTCLSIGPACFFFQRPFGAPRRTRIENSAALRLVEREDGLALAAED